MSDKKETIILGAGLAGLVASIILARDGRNVRVIERANDIGGDLGLHPSLHGTPIDIEKVAAWTGLDTDKMFLKGTKNVQTFIGNQVFYENPIYIVERGNRPSSIDTYLYGEAKKLGVDFEFGRHIKDPNELPAGSIIATGFHPAMYKAFNLRYNPGIGHFKVAENDDPALEGSMFAWIAPYTKDYAYAVVQNGIRYIALFSRFGLAETSLAEFQKHLKDTVGWEYDRWDMRTLPVPWNTRKPKLWIGDYIVTGTVGGMIDPAGGFGIHGAILSGVIAAWAITNPERAKKELKKLNKHFTAAALSFEALKNMPFRETFFKIVLCFPELFLPLTALMGRGIPGYDRNVSYELIKGYYRGKGIGERIRNIKKIFKS